MEYKYELKEGETKWEIIYTDEWRNREKAVYSDPENADISALPAAEYKYFDRFREISVEHKAGHISREEFQEKLRLFRKDYEADINVFADAMAERYSHQHRIKISGETITKLSKGEYSSLSEAFAVAVRCISAMRCEDATEKTIISKAREKGLLK